MDSIDQLWAARREADREVVRALLAAQALYDAVRDENPHVAGIPQPKAVRLARIALTAMQEVAYEHFGIEQEGP